MTALPPRRVVLLVGADGDVPPAGVLGSESTPLAALLGGADGDVAMDVISRGTSRTFPAAAHHVRLDDHAGVTDSVLRGLGAFAARTRFDAFPIGRLLNSIGPVAPSRVFWRALKRHPEALRLLRAADVAVAADLETTKAAWVAVQRGWVDDAFYDHRALALALGRDSPTAT